MYKPRAHAVAYDTRAWERCARPFVPSVPFPAAFAAQIAVMRFGDASAWDTVACYGCLTHGLADLQPCIQVLFRCDAMDAARILQTDAAGCQPWLHLALYSNIRCIPKPTTQASQWAIIQTPERKRYIVKFNASQRVETLYSVVTGAQKRSDALIHTHITSLHVIESATELASCGP